jgi:hypothetical protein
MKQAGYPKRPRGRSSERPRQPQKNTNGDVRDGKSRGNPQQCVDKYLSLAREASSSGDPVTAENYYQYADHYYRMTVENRAPQAPRSERQEGIKGKKPVPPENPSEVASVFG